MLGLQDGRHAGKGCVVMTKQWGATFKVTYMTNVTVEADTEEEDES